MMFVSVHHVTGVELGEIEPLEKCGSYVRHFTAKTKEGDVELSLHGDTPVDLMTADERDAYMRPRAAEGDGR